MAKEKIKDFYGKIIGYIVTDDKNGNKTAMDFYGRILGYYKKDLNITTDFYGRVVSRGDIITGLIYERAAEGNKK